MKTYQTLTLIGGIFGIIAVPLLVLVFSVGLAFLAAFDDDYSTDGEWEELFGVAGIATTLVVSISAIVVAFKMNNPRIIGYVLFGMAAVMIVMTHVAGVISWVFFVVAAISAVRHRN